jgi:four helix bundle protein
MSYRNLEIWKKSKELAISIHELTLKELPKFEMYETGSQIRRSAKSVLANIVEGYGRRKYKNDFIHFLVIAHASLDETMNHLEILFETGSLELPGKYQEIHSRLEELGRMLNTFIKTVQNQHNT